LARKKQGKFRIWNFDKPRNSGHTPIGFELSAYVQFAVHRHLPCTGSQNGVVQFTETSIDMAYKHQSKDDDDTGTHVDNVMDSRLNCLEGDWEQMAMGIELGSHTKIETRSVNSPAGPPHLCIEKKEVRTQVSNGESEKGQRVAKPASFLGIPLQIFSDGST